MANLTTKVWKSFEKINKNGTMKSATTTTKTKGA